MCGLLFHLSHSSPSTHRVVRVLPLFFNRHSCLASCGRRERCVGFLLSSNCHRHRTLVPLDAPPHPLPAPMPFLDRAQKQRSTARSKRNARWRTARRGTNVAGFGIPRRRHGPVVRGAAGEPPAGAVARAGIHRPHGGGRVRLARWSNPGETRAGGPIVTPYTAL